MKKTFILFIKLSIFLGLILFLVQKGALSFAAVENSILQWQYCIPALLCMLAANFLGGFRWHLLLHAQQISLPLSKIFQLNWIGIFFNQALPGAVSGDLIKAFYIGKTLSGQKTKAFGSLLFDRVVGLTSLLLIFATAAFFYPNPTLFHPWIHTLLIVMASLIGLFYCYLLLIPPHHPKNLVTQFFQWLDQKVIFSPLTRLYDSIQYYHFHPLSVLKAILLSVFIQILIGIGCHLLLITLGGGHISWSFLYMAISIGMIVTAIPITPAGIGTGNIAFLYFFKLVGFDSGADLFSLMALCNLFSGALGGLVYLRFKTNSSQKKSIN